MFDLPPVAMVNSYGGSLVVAAVSEGHPVIASLEDKAYGIESQKINFPDLTYYDKREDWPFDLDLRDKIVLGHPPCSAFSSQNRSRGAGKRGPNSEPFRCTRGLLDYVLPRQPRVVAIESVMGALEGARRVHDSYAQAYNYTPYRVLLNSASFGVPQWRRRFWLLLVKNVAADDGNMTFRLKHHVVRVVDALDGVARDLRVLPSQAKRWEQQQVMFRKLGLKPLEVTQLLTEDHEGLIGILARKFDLPKPWWKDQGAQKFITDNVVASGFTSHSLHALNPHGFAPVLLAGSWWSYRGEMLGLDDYKTLMGFPREYKFHKISMTMELLSRGITPPVGNWILRQVRENFFGFEPCGTSGEMIFTCAPGETVDLRLDNKYKVAGPLPVDLGRSRGSPSENDKNTI